MATNSSDRFDRGAENEVIDHMRQQFGRNLSPAEALDLHERDKKIPKCS